MTSDHESPPGDVAPEPEVVGNAADALQVSIRALAALSAQVPLTETLTRVAALAVQAIPGADGAGLTLSEAGRPDTIVASTPLVSEVDDIQYGLGEGPCITAAREGVTVTSGSLGADTRWRGFGSRVARLGVHSVVSLPLLTPSGVVGAMNVYARAKHGFDESAARIGEAFAGPAAIAVQNAQVLAQTRRLAARLQTALDERGVVDQAVGILISRGGLSAGEALDRLRAMSQHDHRKLTDVAGTLVEEAARRARARHHRVD